MDPGASLVWNHGFPTSINGSSISTNPVKAPDIRFSSCRFRKQYSRKLLNLLDHVLFTRNNVDEFHFVPYTQSLLDSDISDKTIHVQKSIIDLFNYLIDETQYLINQITQLIECTMYKRIPELSIFLKDLTNNLDIAHRTGEWRSIVNKASTMPIDNIPSSLDYCQLRLQTDIHLNNLCFINNF
ncbi:unnamed protein product [Schistosoma curassoni]|uniref:Uncharacterized protein n=1 Tax=Schistosoma curassoni TaxID=6186 RepID=A0A183JI16_9TREM|nr:unnamed protein product [Schistosoma curassoni]